MTRYGLVCLLLGALAWAQAAPSNPAAAPQNAAPPAAAPAQPVPETPPDAAVITINGLCENPSANKPAADCKTVITRAEFEKLIEVIQPSMPARVRKQFASNYARALVMAQKAQQLGLDRDPGFDEHMRLARIQILSQAFNKSIQDKASQISDKEIEDYYENNKAKFEQADLDRVYIPKAQQPPAVAAKTPVANQPKSAGDSETVMKAEADKLHTRAAAGEDFAKLQADAYQVAGIKAAAPNAGMAKVRRTSLPADQVTVMDLKVNEVSAVIADQNGYYIYKMKSKEIIPLDQAREEIKGILRSERIQEAMKTVQEDSTPILNESYFTPMAPAPAPPSMMAPRPGPSTKPKANDPDD
jgi:PPIC-type PPIASE domain